MISQIAIMDHIFLIIGQIQLSSKNRESFARDDRRSIILELRERLIEIANELKSIYWSREAYEKDGLVPHDHGEDHVLIHQSKAILKQIQNINSDIRI